MHPKHPTSRRRSYTKGTSSTNCVSVVMAGLTMANQAQQAQNLEKVTDYVEETHLDADKMAKVS